MRIITQRCKPSDCNLECITVCRDVLGKEAALSYDGSQSYPSFNEGNCIGCLKCIAMCPKGAISTFEPVQSIAQKKGKQEKLESVEDFYQPYEVSSDCKQFPESCIIFARVDYDTTFKHFGHKEWFGSDQMIAKQLPGYSRFEHNAAVAGWELYDHRHSVTESALSSQTQETEPNQQNTPGSLTSEIKRAAHFFGADLVGITKFNRRWLYSVNRKGEPYNMPDSIDQAIVMAIEMDYDGISTSPAFTSCMATALGYSKMAFVEIELSALIRRMGYHAIPCGNDVALSVPLAIDAGLGQYGRHGILITKKYGSRIRIAKVLTDMPLIQDHPDKKFCESVLRLCQICEKCAEHCPPQAIPFGTEQTWNGKTKSNNPGIRKWYVDVESCYDFWIINGGECSNCIRSCTYNKKPGLALRFLLWVTQRIPKLNRIILKMDNFFGYGKQKDPQEYWLKIRKS